MGELRFSLKFFGGKAEEHRVAADRLADILHSLGQDIQNVCRIISHDDVNLDLNDIMRGCKLYVTGAPKDSSLEIPIATEQTTSKWPEVAGRTFVSALQQLPNEDDELPAGITRSILEHVTRYSHGDEYDGIHLTVLSNGKPENTVTFDYKMGVIAARRLAELPDYETPTIQGHSITGVMYGLEDQNYDDPDANVIIEVDPGVGRKWTCYVPREKTPPDLAEHWTERVMVHGIATFRPRKPEMVVDELRLLGHELDIDEAIERFIKTNQEVWQGENTDRYMDIIRERD